jgi:hypothetical protein
MADHELEELPVVVALLDERSCRLAASLDADSAVTLIAVASEDPSSWDEMVSYWPRYRTPEMSEFADGLPMQEVDWATAIDAIDETESWCVIDLVQKRICTGRNVMKVDRDAVFAMVTDEKGNQHCPMSVHLPPWWELKEQIEPYVVKKPRDTPIVVPRTNREVLYGSAMIDYLASRTISIAGDGLLPKELSSSKEVDDPEASNELYRLTVNVHRDWLMTPRQDLQGRTPRVLLFGAHDWSDRVIDGQRLRFEDGAPMIAAPDDVDGYEDAPMGREEMIIYFDLCREVIRGGWFWCQNEVDAARLSSSHERAQLILELCTFLSTVRDDWLQQPFEGGSPPSFIIECSRRRVPRGAGVSIAGMMGQEQEQHIPDCDCPLCNMMASGMFGVGFTSLDGHHLELDEEFAFSTRESYEEWEEQQAEWAEMSSEMDRKWAEREAREAAGETEQDEFASAWSSPMLDGPLPGDRFGQMKLAFRLTEIISDLESDSAPNELIKKLNVSFREYCQSEPSQREVAKRLLTSHLDATGQRYPMLVSKVADFQSQVDEFDRAMADRVAGDEKS